MLGNKISRRQMLKSSGFALAGSLFSTVMGCSSGGRTEKEKLPVKRPFRIGMNASTISAYSLSVPEQIELCSEAGFDGVELWIRDVDAFVKQGVLPGSLSSSPSRTDSICRAGLLKWLLLPHRICSLWRPVPPGIFLFCTLVS